MDQNKQILTPKINDDQERTRIGKEAILKALRKTLGIVTPACEETGISRTTYYEWYKTDPEFRKNVDDLHEVELDFVESKLHSLINDKNPAAIIFHLKCQGKKRGYIEKQEIEHSGNLGVSIDVSKLSDKELHAIATGASLSGIRTEKTEEDQ